MRFINLKNSKIDEANARKIAALLGRFENLEAIDLSDNGALGTIGVAMVLEWVGPGVKSVNLKGTGLEPVPVVSNSSPGYLSYAYGMIVMGSSANLKPEVSAHDHSKKLESALRKLAKLEAIDLSDNGALGTLGVAMVLEWVGPGVKSVNLKGTGLGLAAGQSLQQGPSHAPCSAEDWPKLEDALRKLAKLEAIDLSDNGALGTSGVGRLVSCCAGESFSVMARLVRLLLFL